MLERFEMVGLHLVLLVWLAMVWGCAPQQSLGPTVGEMLPPESICGPGMAEQMAALGSDGLGEFLIRAEAEGGAACWSEALRQALQSQRPVPREQLVRALDAFNHNATAGDFHAAVGQYLQGVAAGQGAYGEADRQLLEAYSRYVIRTARSQDDPHLKLAQMACARLDRTLYARLFE